MVNAVSWLTLIVIVRSATGEPMPEEDARRGWTIGSGSSASAETTGISKLATRLAASVDLPFHLLLRGGAGVSWFRQGTTTLERNITGVSLEFPAGGARVDGAWTLHQGVDTLMQEGKVGVVFSPSNSLDLAVSVRRRPFLDAAEPLATDERQFHEAGADGAFILDTVARRGVDELRLSAQGSPVEWAYFYVDAVGERITDGNSASAWTADFLFNPIGFLGAPPLPLDVYLQWESYLLGYAEPRLEYFSPALIAYESPGAEIHVRLRGIVQLGGEGGFTFSALDPSGLSGGWFAGFGARFRVGIIQASIRGQLRRDPWYVTQKLWVAVEVAP